MGRLVQLFQDYCDNQQMEVGVNEESMFNATNCVYTENWMKENDLELIPYTHVLIKVNEFDLGYQLKPQAVQYNYKLSPRRVNLEEVFLEIMNLGMQLRQDQLNGHSDKSGNDVLRSYLNKKGL